MSGINVVGQVDPVVCPVALAKALGFTEGKACNIKTPWFKVMVNDRALVLPALPIRQGISWYALHQADVVKGTVWTTASGATYMCRLLPSSLFSQVLECLWVAEPTLRDSQSVLQVWSSNVNPKAKSYAELLTLADSTVTSSFYQRRLSTIGWIPVFELINVDGSLINNALVDDVSGETTTALTTSLIEPDYTYCLEFRRKDQVIYTVEGSKEELVAFTEVLPKSLEGCEVRLTCKLVGSWSPYVDRDTIDTLLATSL